MDVNGLFSDSVLYYPNIEFLDETWVKNALCIWEKIYRIVPSSYKPNDSDEIKKAIEAGLIENIPFTAKDLSSTAEEFNKFWKQTPYIPAGVEGWEGYDVKLHPEKVDTRILPLLQSLSKKIDPDGWLKLSSEVANTYMLFLSEAISRRRQLPKLTDNPDMFSIMYYFSNDGNIDEYVYNEDSSEITTSLILSLLLPGGLAYSKMETILDIHSKALEGRRLFRKSIMEFSEKLSLIEEKNYTQELIHKFEQELNSSQKSILKGAGQTISDAAPAALSIGIPTTLTALGTFIAMGNPFGFQTIGQASLIGLAATLADVVKSRRNKWNSNESSYYLQLNNVFKDTNGKVTLNISRYDRILEEFIND